jgi:5-methyltetrahydrofolate--homocysteine methyltransferase
MMEELISKNLIEARGIIGFYPCNANEDDDIEVYDENDGKTLKAKFCTIRKKLDRDQDQFIDMSDFVAPKHSGKTDDIGGFAVSSGFKQEEVLKKYEAEDD